MGYLKDALGFGATADGIARKALGDVDDPTDAEALVAAVEQKTEGTTLTVPDVVQKARDVDDRVDATFRADLMADLMDAIEDPTENDLAGEFVGLLRTANAEGVLSANGLSNAKEAAEGGDAERLADILRQDPLVHEALRDGTVAQRVYEKQGGYPDTFPFEGVSECTTEVQDWDDPPEDPGAFCSEWVREVKGEEPAEQMSNAAEDEPDAPEQAGGWHINDVDGVENGWRAHYVADGGDSQAKIKPSDGQYVVTVDGDVVKELGDVGGQDAVDMGVEYLRENPPTEAEQQANTESDTMADKDNEDEDPDEKQEGEGGDRMTAIDLMEQLDQFDSDDLDAVQRTAEMTGRDAQDVAAEIVGDRLNLDTGGGGNAAPDPDEMAETDTKQQEAAAELGDEFDIPPGDVLDILDAAAGEGADAVLEAIDSLAGNGEPPEEDPDDNGDPDNMAENPDDDPDGDAAYVTESELDSKLESFRSDLVDSVTDAVTDEETVAQIGQKMAESEDAREAITDSLVDDVDEKLGERGSTPTPTGEAPEDAGKAADALVGGDD